MKKNVYRVCVEKALKTRRPFSRHRRIFLGSLGDGNLKKLINNHRDISLNKYCDNHGNLHFHTNHHYIRMIFGSTNLKRIDKPNLK